MKLRGVAASDLVVSRTMALSASLERLWYFDIRHICPWHRRLVSARYCVSTGTRIMQQQTALFLGLLTLFELHIFKEGCL